MQRILELVRLREAYIFPEKPLAVRHRTWPTNLFSGWLFLFFLCFFFIFKFIKNDNVLEMDKAST